MNISIKNRKWLVKIIVLCLGLCLSFSGFCFKTKNIQIPRPCRFPCANPTYLHEQI
ncbi:uncharacterized protein G2W53_031024 [Senna tora]|uniref:Uncharacterized protein n=1 Tax=Senna tora TaxID=362788 RepID=A0A834WBC1_9FABA|nr:uncharacterized protein G2W53_031024 [Senna tora]